MAEQQVNINSDEINLLKQELDDLHEISNSINKLLLEHGDCLENIEKNTNDADKNVENAKEQLVVAKSYNDSNIRVAAVIGCSIITAPISIFLGLSLGGVCIVMATTGIATNYAAKKLI